MAFDPITLLTIVLFLSAGVGGVLIRMSFAEADGLSLRSWGFGLIVSGAGTALTLMEPGTAQTLPLALGLALLIVAHAVFWGAARSFTRRPIGLGMMLAGPLLWCAVLPLGLAPPWRVAISSGLRAFYGIATARELRQSGGPTWKSQEWMALLFASHGAFMVLRAGLGGVAQALWPALVPRAVLTAATGIETILFTGILGALAVLLGRERVLDLHRRAALEDALTGVGNRRALEAAWGRIADDAGGDGRTASLLLMDLDGFKAVNDRHGHETGDRLLSAFAGVMRDRMPPSGQAFRIGGEEFVVLLRSAGPQPAFAVAEDLRRSFGRISVPGPHGPVGTTVSVGIAHAGAGASSDMGDLIRRADRSLYAAKAGGRDRVVDEAGTGVPAPG